MHCPIRRSPFDVHVNQCVDVLPLLSLQTNNVQCAWASGINKWRTIGSMQSRDPLSEYIHCSNMSLVSHRMRPTTRDVDDYLLQYCISELYSAWNVVDLVTSTTNG